MNIQWNRNNENHSSLCQTIWPIIGYNSVSKGRLTYRRPVINLRCQTPQRQSLSTPRTWLKKMLVENKTLTQIYSLTLEEARAEIHFWGKLLQNQKGYGAIYFIHVWLTIGEQSFGYTNSSCKLKLEAAIKNGWLPWYQGSWGQHGAHLGPTGPRGAPCWPHGLCHLVMHKTISNKEQN